MWLHVPENAFWDWTILEFDSPDIDGDYRSQQPWGDSVPDPTPEVLDAVLAGMREGRLEYVTLAAEKNCFLQAAGDGDGPYQLERRAQPDAPLLATDRPATFDLVRRAMHAYLAGQPEPDDLRWGEEVAPPPKKGLFGRLFGK
jgi:hypothetical protein